MSEFVGILKDLGPAATITAMFLWFILKQGGMDRERREKSDKLWQSTIETRDQAWRATIERISSEASQALEKQGDRMERISDKGHEAAFALSHEIAKMNARIRSDENQNSSSSL